MWGRIFFLFLILVNLFLAYNIFFGHQASLFRLLALKEEYFQSKMELSVLHRKNIEKSEQIRAVKNNPEQLELVIRKKFHYVRPGEVVYVQKSLSALK